MGMMRPVDGYPTTLAAMRAYVYRGMSGPEIAAHVAVAFDGRALNGWTAALSAVRKELREMLDAADAAPLPQAIAALLAGGLSAEDVLTRLWVKPPRQARPGTPANDAAPAATRATGVTQQVRGLLDAGVKRGRIRELLGLTIGQLKSAEANIATTETTDPARRLDEASRASRLAALQRQREIAEAKARDAEQIVSGVLPVGHRWRSEPLRASDARARAEARARREDRYLLRHRATGALLGAAGEGLVSEPAHAWVGFESQLAKLRARNAELADWIVVRVPAPADARTMRW